MFFVTISYAQQGIELRLINFSYQNDAGLNNIINSHNVFSFTPKSGHLYPAIQDRIFQIQGGDNTTTLLNDFINYNSVVESATIADASFFSDCCIAQILTASIGTPVGFNNGIVLTNDPGLNTIFQNFNVYYYT